MKREDQAPIVGIRPLRGRGCFVSSVSGILIARISRADINIDGDMSAIKRKNPNE